MGCVYNRGTRAKPNYWLRWVGRDGHLKYQHIGPDRGLAKAVLSKIEGDLVAKKFEKKFGIPSEPPPEVPQFDDAADRWIEMRSRVGADGQPTFRCWRDDRTRLNLHLRRRFAGKLLDEITSDDVRKLIEDLRPVLRAQTIRNVLHVLSRLYEDQPKAMRLVNPVRELDRNDRRRIGEGWDPRKTPFLRTKAEVRRLYLAFPEMSPSQPFRAIYAVGALAGLRPGEVRALQWTDIDFNTQLIHVQRSVTGPTKDSDSRHVPLVPALAEVLHEWREHCPIGSAIVFPSTGTTGRYVNEDTFRNALRVALRAAGLAESLTTYETTRHTFGAQWVINGGSLHKLSAVLGHSSTEVTMRYGHLVPGEYTQAERALVDLDLQPARVLPLQQAAGASA
jgi:integrase